MTEKKGDMDYGFASYIIGIVSIVAGVFAPLAGFVLGIVGINLSKRDKGETSKRGAKLSKIGIIVSIIVLAITILITYIVTKYIPVA